MVIPQFITHVKMSNSRRPKYYTSSDRIPKKYHGYSFDTKGRLITPDGEPILRNARSVNTPRMRKINGQEFYSGVTRPALRVKIVNGIKDSFRPYIQDVPKVKQFPVKILCELHDLPGRADWDLDNKWIYCKVFQDLLVQEGRLPDDNIKFVSQAAAMEYYPVEDEQDRKLVFHIITDDRNHNSFYG